MLGVAVFVLAVGSAWAADKSADEKNETAVSNPARPEPRTFAELDKNNNGFISKAEARADPELARDFDKFDLNHDGKLNRAEFRAARGQEEFSPGTKKITGKGKEKKKEPVAATRP
jgi:hypothetical protein